MKLKQLEVEGFRGFADRKVFDLSADATVIIGANGRGKTSLLDAVCWGLSGAVGRIDGGDSSLVSMYSQTGQARVSIELIGADGRFSITRTTDGESQTLRARIRDDEFRETSARARILEQLWPEGASAKDGEQALSSALTRSVYLQQDRLRDFLEGASDQDRFNVISELVGAGHLTELQSQLESESRSWSRATTQMRSDIRPLDERVEKLKAHLQKLRSSASVGSELQKTTWTAWWENCKKLGVAVPAVPSATSADAASHLDNTLREIRSLRDGTRRQRELLIKTKELLTDPPPESSVDIVKLQEAVATAKSVAANTRARLKAAQEDAAARRQQQVATREQSEQRKALAQLALQLLEDRCPVCQQEHNVVETRERLQQIINSTTETSEIALPTEKVEELAASVKKAITDEQSLREELVSATHVRQEYEQWATTRDEKLEELRITQKEGVEELLDARIQTCESSQIRLKEQAERGEELALNIVRELAKARIGSAEVDLRSAESELAEQLATLETREDTSMRTKLLIERLRGARSKVAIDKLSEIEPLLQRIFARIDPHPAFRVVSFATDVVRGKGRLDAEIHDRQEGKTSKAPETILSSSQLNALAVSMFLSFNLSIPSLPLNAALLDDPMQSLDEINLLGLVDLLRRAKRKRQIVVSTHDKRFGRLLAKKLRPVHGDESTSVIELHGWKRSGPEVVQYSVEADSMPLRFAAVA